MLWERRGICWNNPCLSACVRTATTSQGTEGQEDMFRNHKMKLCSARGLTQGEGSSGEQKPRASLGHLHCASKQEGCWSGDGQDMGTSLHTPWGMHLSRATVSTRDDQKSKRNSVSPSSATPAIVYTFQIPLSSFSCKIVLF